jgi:hypothetical protein
MKTNFFYKHIVGDVHARAHSPKAEKLVNRRLDMIDMGQTGQPGYLQMIMIKQAV